MNMFCIIILKTFSLWTIQLVKNNNPNLYLFLVLYIVCSFVSMTSAKVSPMGTGRLYPPTFQVATPVGLRLLEVPFDRPFHCDNRPPFHPAIQEVDHGEEQAKDGLWRERLRNRKEERPPQWNRKEKIKELKKAMERGLNSPCILEKKRAIPSGSQSEASVEASSVEARVKIQASKPQEEGQRTILHITSGTMYVHPCREIIGNGCMCVSRERERETHTCKAWPILYLHPPYAKQILIYKH